jgi:hypothetical protein
MNESDALERRKANEEHITRILALIKELEQNGKKENEVNKNNDNLQRKIQTDAHRDDLIVGVILLNIRLTSRKKLKDRRTKARNSKKRKIT